MELHELEQQQLLNNFLLNNYLIKNNNTTWLYCPSVELIYKTCNSTCSYCNLILDSKDKEDEKILLKNLSYFLETIINNKIFISHFYINCNINFNILNILNNYLSKIPKQVFKIYNNINITYYINIFNKQINDQFQQYKNMLNKNNINLLINLVIENNIEILSNTENLLLLNDEQYAIQPIISVNNINKINFLFNKCLFLLKEYDKINICPFQIIKNNKWNTSQIEQYKNFLIQSWDEVINIFNFNKLSEELVSLNNNIFNIFKLQQHNYLSEHIQNCNLQNTTLYINLSNLSIPICNSLITHQFIAGKIDNNTNILVENGLSSFLQIKTLSPNFYPICGQCIYKNLCNKGCLGEQYKNSGEILLPIKNICTLEQTRINTLINLYKQYKIFK